MLKLKLKTMATKYMTLDKTQNPEGKRTVFENIVEVDSATNVDGLDTDDYDNVLFLGHDQQYGDVFKAWNDAEPDDFTLFFGAKGDEFDQ